MNGILSGGCQCSAVRYTLAGAKIGYCCHCTECQKQSASAFGISVPVPRVSLTIEGPLGCWTRSTDSGASTDCHFCLTCGTRVYHAGQKWTGMVTVKGGSLDDPQAIDIVAHIWTRSARTDIARTPGLPEWEGQPELDGEWGKLLQRNFH